MPGANDGEAGGPARDRISLSGIVCQCHIGVTEEERATRQRIEVDLDLVAPLEAAGRSGVLEQTIDYRQVCDAVRGLLEDGRFHLIEAAAVAVLERVLQRFPPVVRAVVRVRKYVLTNVSYVEVQMERGR
jgi:dihydroneopterin aldolase